MAKRKQAEQREKERSASEYYKLNVSAVEDLVHADVTNSPKVSERELRRYRSGPKLRMADWAKALLLKIWFAGAVCFFFLWGLGAYLPNQWDQLAVLGIALGFVTDLLTNPALRFIAKTPEANDRWMMIPRKGFASLPLNLLYAFLLLALVVMTYQGINRAGILLTGDEERQILGVGPILFGIFTTLWDLLLIQGKRVLRRIVVDAKRSAREGVR